ncbi:MAG: hypothetical protein P4M11_01840 [Candidatus Pacebacteria bacterium]|nr:hypothetical protein [Candidatus Paceibacterota bacterium]
MMLLCRQPLMDASAHEFLRQLEHRVLYLARGWCKGDWIKQQFKWRQQWGQEWGCLDRMLGKERFDQLFVDLFRSLVERRGLLVHMDSSAGVRYYQQPPSRILPVLVLFLPLLIFASPSLDRSQSLDCTAFRFSYFLSSFLSIHLKALTRFEIT